MTDESSWARSSLRITCQLLSRHDIASRLEPGAPLRGSRQPDLWITDIETDSDEPLDVQIEHVKQYLTLNHSALRDISRSESIDLVIGWSPRSPQDGLVLDAELLAILAELNARIFLDTYLD